MGRPLSNRQAQVLRAISTCHLTGVTPCATQIRLLLDPPIPAHSRVTEILRRLQRAGKVERYGRTDKGILWRRRPT